MTLAAGTYPEPPEVDDSEYQEWLRTLSKAERLIEDAEEYLEMANVNEVCEEALRKIDELDTTIVLLKNKTYREYEEEKRRVR